jgi:hypothetical protein
MMDTAYYGAKLVSWLMVQGLAHKLFNHDFTVFEVPRNDEEIPLELIECYSILPLQMQTATQDPDLEATVLYATGMATTKVYGGIPWLAPWNDYHRYQMRKMLDFIAKQPEVLAANGLNAASMDYIRRQLIMDFTQAMIVSSQHRDTLVVPKGRTRLAQIAQPNDDGDKQELALVLPMCMLLFGLYHRCVNRYVSVVEDEGVNMTLKKAGVTRTFFLNRALSPRGTIPINGMIVGLDFALVNVRASTLLPGAVDLLLDYYRSLYKRHTN